MGYLVAPHPYTYPRTYPYLYLSLSLLTSRIFFDGEGVQGRLEHPGSRLPEAKFTVIVPHGQDGVQAHDMSSHVGAAKTLVGTTRMC